MGKPSIRPFFWTNPRNLATQRLLLAAADIIYNSPDFTVLSICACILNPVYFSPQIFCLELVVRFIARFSSEIYSLCVTFLVLGRTITLLFQDLLQFFSSFYYLQVRRSWYTCFGSCIVCIYEPLISRSGIFFCVIQWTKEISHFDGILIVHISLLCKAFPIIADTFRSLSGHSQTKTNFHGHNTMIGSMTIKAIVSLRIQNSITPFLQY